MSDTESRTWSYGQHGGRRKPGTTIRLGDDAERVIGQAAAVRGMKLSSYIRWAALDRARADVRSAAARGLDPELPGQGKLEITYSTKPTSSAPFTMGPPPEPAARSTRSKRCAMKSARGRCIKVPGHAGKCTFSGT